MTTAHAATHRGPIQISRVPGIVALLWAALVIESGFLAIAVGWAPDGPVTRILDVLLWPGSLVAFVGLGLLPRRGGLLLGLIGGLLVGLTCAIVLATLPDAQLPLIPPTTANRVYSIIESVWALPVTGMALAAVGMGLRRLVTGQWQQDRLTRSGMAPVNDLVEARWASSPADIGDRPLGASSGHMPVGLAMAAGAGISIGVARATRD